MNKVFRFKLILIVKSSAYLITGTLIYLFLGRNTFIHSLLFELTGIEIQGVSVVENSFILNFLRCYFVDFIWLSSFFNAFLATQYRLNFRSVFWAFIITFSVGVCYELFQLFGILNGTSDFIDIIMYLTAGLFSAAVNIIFMKARRLV